MKDIEFSRNLIKGRITEVIFEQMIREESRYDVIPFGYEHTMPTLAQYQHLAEVKNIINNISDAPDFVLISLDKKKIYLVEVKYQTNLNLERLKQYSRKLLKRWECPYLFVATPGGFYCSLCKTVNDQGTVSPLSDKWVAKERRVEYLKLLNEFEKR